MSPIRTLVVVASLVLTVAACGSKTGAAGTYELDIPAFKASIGKAMESKIAQLPDEERAAAKAAMAANVDLNKIPEAVKMTITLNADGTATSVDSMDGMTAKKGAGTWQQEGQKVTVSMKTEGEATADAKTMDIRGNDLVTMLDTEFGTLELVLRRK